MRKIKIAIVDDHKIVRDGIKALFMNDKEMEFAGDFEGADDLFSALKQIDVDLVILDMNMPKSSGMDVAKALFKNNPDARVLIHTMSEKIEDIEQMVKVGVQGYVLKTAGRQELESAIKMVAGGSTFFGQSVMDSYVRTTISTQNKPVYQLTTEERQVLKLYCDEVEIEGIAKVISRDKITVKKILDRIKNKLKIKSDIGLVKFSITNRYELSV